MIGLFGSAFNPPTKGHAYVIREARKTFDRVLAVPSFDHCFGKAMASYDVRLMLTKAFVEDLNDPYVQVSAVEREIWTGGPVSSYDVLTALRLAYPDQDIQLIIGQDNANHFERFKNHEKIVKEFGVFVVPEAKEGFPRSTEIRRRIEASEGFESAVTDSVAALLKDHHNHFLGI